MMPVAIFNGGPHHLPPGRSWRISVVGGTGFIGSHVLTFARSAGIEATPVHSIRISDVGTDDPRAGARDWLARHSTEFDHLCATLAGSDVVVNAAGLAEPGGLSASQLHGANAVQPAVIARAAHCADVRRLVHVSSAVVQGRSDPLDETTRYAPLSLYGISKVKGEQVLLEGGDIPTEVVVYRPTSVQAESRSVTRRLARLASLPVVPVVGTGTQPVPVALVENVAAGIIFSSTVADPASVVLQPWEGVTTRLLMELFAPRHIVPVPPAMASWGRRLVARSAGSNGSLAASARRLEVVLWGQGVDAKSLSAAGFRPPLGLDAWWELGSRMQSPRKGQGTA